MKKTTQLCFGAMCEPIDKQLEKIGYKFVNQNKKEKWKKMLFARTMLSVHSIITDSENNKILDRMIKAMRKDIEKISW